MRRAYFVGLFLCFAATILLAQSNLAQSNPIPLHSQNLKATPPASLSSAETESQVRILDEYGKLPLSFEANRGQADGRVKFLSRAGGYTLFLTTDEAVLALSGSKATTPASRTGSIYARAAAKHFTRGVLRMKLRDANPAARVTGHDELAGTSNYFIRNDPARWQSNVPTYAKVKYEGIYPGIDLVYYGTRGQIEYDFMVAPGVDPHRIAFDVVGASGIRCDQHGDLLFKIGEDEIRWLRPVVYQDDDGARQLVAARYAITGTNRVGFEVADYDASRPLYIDPLIYSTYLGGSGDDYAYGVVADSAGNAYITGQTFSTDFPVTPGAFQTVCGGKAGSGCYKHGEAFIAKLNPAGSALLYSTYLGGSGGDIGSGIALDSAGNVYITGQTYSTNFPITPGVFQQTCAHPNCGYGDAFVTKLNSTGSALLYSSYLGGSGADWGGNIVIDKAGNAYVTGATSSTDFPTTPGAFQTVCGDVGCIVGDAFVAKINPTASALVYSTYLGGSGIDYGRGIAVDKAGNAHVIGGTLSPNFPVTAGVLQPLCGDPGCALGDAFVAKLNPTGSALVYSTYLGGDGFDIGTSIAIDAAGHAYVVGWTGSDNFPTRNPVQPYYAGGGDTFVTKINPAATALIYSTYLGGSGEDNGNSVALDSKGNVYIGGGTSSPDFPTMNPMQAVNNGYNNAFVTELDSSGTAWAFSTYIGGSNYDAGTSIAVDDAGNEYLVGATDSTNFPTQEPLQAANNGGFDAFIAKLGAQTPTTTTLSSSPNPSTYGQAVTFTAMVTSSHGAPPNGETITFMKGRTVLGTGALDSGAAIFTDSTLPVGTSSITAVYSGDSNFAGSTSKAVKQVVDKAGQ